MKILKISLFSLFFCLATNAAIHKSITKKDLLNLIADEYSADDQIMDVATKILDRVYEAKPRAVLSSKGKNPGGLTFPINPEVLAHIMEQGRDKAFLEIAGAAGENAILIGLAGAKDVYVNDREPVELEKFKATIALLPEELQAKFHVIPGDLFHVLKTEKLLGKFDIIYARNILHFFAGKKRNEFINLSTELLKKNGQLIISMNSALAAAQSLKVAEKYPDTYAFKAERLALRNSRSNQLFHQTIIPELEPDTCTPQGYQWIRLVSFLPLGESLLMMQSDHYDALVDVQKNAINTLLSKMPVNGDNTIEMHQATNTGYTEKTLAKLLTESKLKMQEIFHIKNNGHITSKKDERSSIGVVLVNK